MSDKSLEDQFKDLVCSSVALKNSFVAMFNFIEDTINSDELSTDQKMLIVRQFFTKSKDLLVKTDIPTWAKEDCYG